MSLKKNSMSESAKSQIGQRLRCFRESMQMSQVQMAKMLSGTARGLQDNELGRSFPNSKVLIGLHNLGLNINWLLSGGAPMLLIDQCSSDDILAADLKIYGECLEQLEFSLNKANRKLTPEKKRIAVDKMYRAWGRERKMDLELLEMITLLAA